MAKCKMCGAEVKIGHCCDYCGSMAEFFYYPFSTRIREKITPQKNIEPQPETQLDEERNYTIVKGDNLWNIAKRFYGNGSEYMKIVNANPQIKNPNLIYPGQKITIPK